MHIDDRMPETRRLLLLVWSLSSLLVGCASAPQVKVAAEVSDAGKAKSRSVAVVADLYMDDQVEADRVADLMRTQLTASGFKVQDTENEAELVIVPTMELSKASSSQPTRLPRVWRSFDLSYGLGQANMMESQNALRNLGFGFESESAPEQLKAGLMVTAVTREAWFKALLDEKTEIPRVWRIIAVSPVKKDDVTAKLVEAVGSKLNEVAGAAAEPAKPQRSRATSPQAQPAATPPGKPKPAP
jgi:hypothetical protein